MNKNKSLKRALSFLILTVMMCSTAMTVFSASVSKVWDFEDGILPGGHRNCTIVDIEGRGKVLKYTDTGDYPSYDMGSAVTSGQYVFSHEYMWGANQNKTWQIWIEDESSRIPVLGINENRSFNTLGGNEWDWQPTGFSLAEDVWYRFDFAVDMDEYKLYAYIDGAYLCEVDLAEKNVTSFKGFVMRNRGKDAFIDNIILREMSLSDKSADDVITSVSGKTITLNFPDTALDLTNDSFTVKKSDSPLSAEWQSVGAEIVLNNGNTAVLQLDAAASAGDFYKVAFNNVTSFMDTKIVGETFAGVAKTANTKAVGAISFMDGQSKRYSAENVSSAVDKMIISFPSGVRDSSDLANKISISCQNVPQIFTGVWDNDTKTYTLSFNEFLGVEKEYSVLIDGVTAEDGSVYDTVSGTIKTGESLIVVSDIAFETAGDRVSVSFYGVNTSEDKSCVVVWAGYDANGALVDMNFDTVTLKSGEAKSYTASIKAISSGVEAQRAWIWESFEKVLPMASSVFSK